MSKNNYVESLSFYEACPKEVFAAIAVSALTCGGDYLERAEANVNQEWWALYNAGIVKQKPNKKPISFE